MAKKINDLLEMEPLEAKFDRIEERGIEIYLIFIDKEGNEYELLMDEAGYQHLKTTHELLKYDSKVKH
jgi:hypothetical protein